jgi:hypothetical protein
MGSCGIKTCNAFLGAQSITHENVRNALFHWPNTLAYSSRLSDMKEKSFIPSASQLQNFKNFLIKFFFSKFLAVKFYFFKSDLILFINGLQSFGARC